MKNWLIKKLGGQLSYSAVENSKLAELKNQWIMLKLFENRNIELGRDLHDRQQVYLRLIQEQQDYGVCNGCDPSSECCKKRKMPY